MISFFLPNCTLAYSIIRCFPRYDNPCNWRIDWRASFRAAKNATKSVRRTLDSKVHEVAFGTSLLMSDADIGEATLPIYRAFVELSAGRLSIIELMVNIGDSYLEFFIVTAREGKCPQKNWEVKQQFYSRKTLHRFTNENYICSNCVFQGMYVVYDSWVAGKWISIGSSLAASVSV